MGKDRFLSDFREAQKLYPHLKYETSDGTQHQYKVSGSIPIIDRNETHWGQFEVAIYFTANYPYGFAILQETSDHIPRDIDRHISEDGICCVCSPLEKLSKLLSPMSILGFIRGYVIPFFANQIYFESYGSFVNGEYAHYKEGLWEALSEVFGTDDKAIITRKLKGLKGKLRVNSLCPCGSGKKLKRCHMDVIKTLKKIL